MILRCVDKLDCAVRIASCSAFVGMSRVESNAKIFSLTGEASTPQSLATLISLPFLPAACAFALRADRRARNQPCRRQMPGCPLSGPSAPGAMADAISPAAKLATLALRKATNAMPWRSLRRLRLSAES